MRYSLVIPCFNEAKSLPELVEACQNANFPDNAEIILVDNGSTDGSWLVLERLCEYSKNIRLLRVKVNNGYGNGILTGLKACEGEIVGWTHADLQTNPADFLEAIKLYESKAGKKFIKGARKKRPFNDQIFTIGMSFFESVLLKTWMWDINAQPTVFDKQFFETWSNPPSDFSLDLFAYYQAKKQKYNILRFGVYFGSRRYGRSHWNLNLKEKIKFIRRTVRYSIEMYRNTN